MNQIIESACPRGALLRFATVVTLDAQAVCPGFQDNVDIRLFT
jgi:hypothetical protein